MTTNKLHTLKVFYFRPCDANIVLMSVHSMQTSAKHGLEKREDSFKITKLYQITSK